MFERKGKKEGRRDTNLIVKTQAPNLLVYSEQRLTDPTRAQSHPRGHQRGPRVIRSDFFSAGTFNLPEEIEPTCTQ